MLTSLALIGMQDVTANAFCDFIISGRPYLCFAYSLGRIFQNRSEPHQLARIQFHFLPPAPDQSALEVTLALPYSWWRYRDEAMIGLKIGAWSDLPIEPICVWMAVTSTTVIVYALIKIWKALGIRALWAFLGNARRQTW